jgi:hypothetical protein
MEVFSWIGNLVFESEEGEQTQLFRKIFGRKKEKLTGIQRQLHIKETHYLHSSQNNY